MCRVRCKVAVMLLEQARITSGLELPSARRGEVAAQVAAWTHQAHAGGEPVLSQSAETIESQLALGLSVLAWFQGELAGHFTAYQLAQDEQNRWWYEAGTLIVPAQFRGQGIGNQLCQGMAGVRPDSYLVPTTKNQYAIPALLHAGFEPIPFPHIPGTVREGLCYSAPCFIQNGHPGSCAKEHNLGGACVALVRKPYI